MRTSELVFSFSPSLNLTGFDLRRHVLPDPSFFHDPSGCTAIAALLTSDRKLYVVRVMAAPPWSDIDDLG